MKLVTASAGSYPRIGKAPELQLLRQTITQCESGKKTDADLRAAEDALTRAAIAEQAGAGLDLVTDGQIRWYDPISHLAGKLENVTINGLLRFFDTNFYFRQPVVRGPIRWTRPLLRAEYEMARAASPKPVKPVLTGAFTLARHSIVEHPPYQKDFRQLVLDYNEAVAQEVRELAAAGASVIQVDEPSILQDPASINVLEETIQRIASLKGTARLALQVYFGDPGPILERLLALPVDIVGLDFTYSPDLVERVAAAKPGKSLGLGLFDGRNTKLEDPQTIRRALDRILSQVRAEECYLQPSSGLEYLPRDRALEKLKRLVAIRNQSGHDFSRAAPN
jgi:5-methyltetrahydropteroyltriglutamate--homocysteine methyltransferase